MTRSPPRWKPAPEPRRSCAVSLPDVTIDSVKTTDSREAIVDYDINNPDLTQPFYIQIYRSDQPTFESDDPNNVAVGQPYAVTNLQPGHPQTPPSIDLSQQNSNWGAQGTSQPGQDNLILPLAPDPSLPYVLAVVVDAQGKVPANLTTYDSRAHFKIWVIADVTYGFQITSTPPDWPQQMAAALQGFLPAGADYASAARLQLEQQPVVGDGPSGHRRAPALPADPGTSQRAQRPARDQRRHRRPPHRPQPGIGSDRPGDARPGEPAPLPRSRPSRRDTIS